jgi:WD40 repeat protein
MSRPAPPILFFAFANDRVEGTQYLRNLPEERRRVLDAMAVAERAGLCEVKDKPNATVAEVLNFFQDARFRDRVAVFHFGGHAGSGVLLFETPLGAAKPAHARSFAHFLGMQHGLVLVFLNGCSTRGQVQDLLDSGVPAVIATAEKIPDLVAMELSSRFYKALASGAPLRAAFREAVDAVQTQTGDEAHLWDFHIKPGAEERVERWSLPVIAGDPLFGLPELPEMDLPREPFKSLAPFTRADVHIFFGRGREIRELYEAATLPREPPIILLFGAAGAGKSSLLAAGVLPRLEAAHEVLYLRRDGLLGLTGTLNQALPGWRQREEKTGKPLIVVLDQVEEAWTRPLPKKEEIVDFASILSALFAERDNRPQGRLILGFRKEWLPEILRLLDSGELPRRRIEITHLDENGVQEAVTGVASIDRIQRQYHLKIEEDLPALIMGDLLKQREDTIAPILQILLTKMWTHATKVSSESPHFTDNLYKEMKSRGLLLGDFLQEQLDGLRAWKPELVDSGLVLDLLAHHTTPLSTAETHREAEVVERYKHRPEIPELLERCKDRYLLSGRGETTESRTTRLAHDTLAPLIRQRFEESILPGQRALRILQQRAVDWDEGNTGAPLDEIDLARVEEGQEGMRARTPDEERLVAASRREAERRKGRRRGLQIAAVAAVVLILGAAGWAWWKGRQALASEARGLDRERAAVAANLVEDQPTKAGLVLLEIQQPDATPIASNLLLKIWSRPLEAALLPHTEWVVVASFSPDGTQVVTASRGKTEAQIWSTVTGQRVATLKGHAGLITAASFSPDGTRVVTASSDQTAQIWDAIRGRPLATLKGHTGAVTTASFSPDGSRVVTASSDKTARIWDTITGQPVKILTGHSGLVRAASFSSDGARVVTASWDKTARIWDAITGQPVRILTGHSGLVTVASFSPDGTRVLTASRDKTARVWNAMTGQPVAIFTGYSGLVDAASFSPDGKQVVTTFGDPTARIWNAITGQPVTTLTGHAGVVYAASFSPDGTQVVTASSDQTARIWSAITGRLVTTVMGHTGLVSAALFSPDGTQVATASSDKTTRIWNVVTGQPVATLRRLSNINAASFSPDGTQVVTASSDETAQVWNTLMGRPVASLKGHTGALYAASFSPDGTQVVTASSDQTARIWNVITRRSIVTLKGHTGEVYAASFSPDGAQVVTASSDQTARIWNAITGQAVSTLTGHKGKVCAASFSPDGAQVVTASSDQTARIWNVTTGQPVSTLTGHTGEVCAASFSSDGAQVVTASSDQTARIWNVTTGQPVSILPGHKGEVLAASFSSDGTRMVTASWDQRARIWKTNTGQPLVTLTTGPAEGVLIDASFSPDSTRVMTASWNQIEIWPSSDEYLQSLIRAQTRLCLGAEFRQTTLGENPQEAKDHEQACNTCVPKFFARLKGVAKGDAKTHIAAWREYRQCLEDAE